MATNSDRRKASGSGGGRSSQQHHRVYNGARCFCKMKAVIRVSVIDMERTLTGARAKALNINNAPKISIRKPITHVAATVKTIDSHILSDPFFFPRLCL
ncbi:hypothetical protein SESBI_35123 [Sesbania bispinosa]|nr:hypothetical protein SESBI_35123 [Sesbania bispinosa]